MISIDRTINTELLRYLEKEKLSISSFANQSGINSGTLSRFLNGNQLLSVSSLDQITKAMNLEEGFFYSLYVMESTPNWRRLGPFIMRCAEVGKLNCIDQAVDLIIDNPAYSSLLFDSAETLFHHGYLKAALIIYKKVAESEKHQHAERLALCQYRIFICSLNSDQEHNLNCTIQFETYIKRLPESVQLDALKDLSNTFLSLRKWNKARHYAQEMGRISRILYAQKHNPSRTRQRRSIDTAKPLFRYILFSDLLLGSIAEEMEDYDRALYYLARYEDHSWILEADETAERTKEQFRQWARGNRYLYQLMKGKIEVLEPYIEYLSSRENEILRGLFKMIQAANMFHFDMDTYLERYESLIRDHLQRRESIGSYTEQIMDDRFANFLTDVGMYYIRRDNFPKGSQYILDSLEFSYNHNNAINIVRCCTTIEHIQSKLNQADLHRYKAIRNKLKV